MKKSMETFHNQFIGSQDQSIFRPYNKRWISCSFYTPKFNRNGYINNVRMHYCKVENAVMVDVNISNVKFCFCDLRRINFSYASLYNVEFVGCNMPNSNFKSANMQDCIFIGCNLNSSSFNKANMMEVFINDSNLIGVTHNDTYIQGGGGENIVT